MQKSKSVKAAILQLAIDLGGPGSGNWAHVGRKGQVGGSAPRDTGMTLERGKDWLERYERTAGRKHPLAEQIEKDRASSKKAKAQETAKKRIAELTQRRDELQRGIDERQTKIKDIDKQLKTLKNAAVKGKMNYQEYFAQSGKLWNEQGDLRREITQMQREVEDLSQRIAGIEELVKGPRPSGAALAKAARAQLEESAKKWGDTTEKRGEIEALSKEVDAMYAKLAGMKQGTKERMAFTLRVSAKCNQLHDAQAALNKALDRVKSDAREILKVDKPIDVDLRWGSKFSDSDPRKAAITEGLKIFQGMVSEQPDLANHVIVRKGGAGRASASVTEPAINITTYSGKATVIHELGHWLEDNSTWIKGRVYDFYERRTQNQGQVSMNRAAQTAGYRSNEKTAVDKFINPYMGKSYVHRGKRYATEILSMGLEYFYSDPLKLAREDPEYFDFIFSVVRGME